MSTIEELKARVEHLERELSECRSNPVRGGRAKIDEISSEVVDSNPYR